MQTITGEEDDSRFSLTCKTQWTHTQEPSCFWSLRSSMQDRSFSDWVTENNRKGCYAIVTQETAMWWHTTIIIFIQVVKVKTWWRNHTGFAGTCYSRLIIKKVSKEAQFARKWRKKQGLNDWKVRFFVWIFCDEPLSFLANNFIFLEIVILLTILLKLLYC